VRPCTLSIKLSSTRDPRSPDAVTQTVHPYETVLVELGFPALVVVSGRLSVADLHPSRTRRCGIYVLEHADGMHYIGQAVDVVRRFAQHRKVSPDIVRFSFFEVGRRALDAEERRCIQDAEARGLRLRNRMLVKQVLVETDLDDVLSPEEQQGWLETPARFASEARLPLDPDQSQRLRFRPQFERLRREPEFERVGALLRAYIEACVPVARRTELSFWSVSCLPGTNRSHHPRWAAVSIGEMETFVLGWLPGSREPWAFINVSLAAFRPETRKSLERAGVSCERKQRGYRAAAGDDLRLSTGASTFVAMTNALREPTVARAARVMNLQLMRKRPNWYAKFHCFDLADRVL
jgi:hypothetical protein